jgi:hypothetical protein
MENDETKKLSFKLSMRHETVRYEIQVRKNNVETKTNAIIMQARKIKKKRQYHNGGKNFTIRKRKRLEAGDWWKV